MDGRNSSVASVRSWRVCAAGYWPSALHCHCRRMRTGDARGQYRTGGRRVTSKAETNGTKREVDAESAGGRRPNTALQRIAARWRFHLNPKGSVWAARAEGRR